MATLLPQLSAETTKDPVRVPHDAAVADLGAKGERVAGREWPAKSRARDIMARGRGG